MPTKVMFGRKFDARPDRIDFRDLPYRARLRTLPDQYPSPQDIKTCLPAYRADRMVLNQGEEGSCTGFGLCAVVNYLRWELWLAEKSASKKAAEKIPKVSARMLYHNARLYDEWKGEDYEGSSCRGAMKGFHKHGVCEEEFWPSEKGGRALKGWDLSAPRAPLGAYYRIEAKAIVEMQSAIYETHAIYVSADVHDGWDRVKKSRTLEDATIEPAHDPDDVGGHAFALVGYTERGFIVQNSWGPQWGYYGFALLPYEDWVRNGTDAWALALGAPMVVVLEPPKPKKGKKGGKPKAELFRSPAARTDVSLDERLRARAPLRVAAAADASKISPWVDGQEAQHIIFIGHDGSAERELVAAEDSEDAVRIVVEDGIREASAKGISKVAIYDHGGLNSVSDGIKRAQIMGPWFEANGIYPIFVVWQSGFLESAGDIIRLALEKVGLMPREARGFVLEKLAEMRDRAFEVIARDTGVKALWENMKSRAQGASAKDGGLMLAAAHLKSVITALNGKPEIHLLGHSAGAIMQGYFLDALKTNGLTAETIHLWAPACTVELATATYGAAFANNVAKPRSTFVELLTDANEERYGCVPGGYSMSLLYLVSRALEPDHKTPILGMQKVWRKWRDDTAFNSDAAFKQDLDAWQQASKSVALADPIAPEKVPRLREKNKEDLIDADHGSFDNNLDVVNRAIAHILGREEPKVVVTDLRGF